MANISRLQASRRPRRAKANWDWSPLVATARRRAATGAGQLLLLGNGRTDKDQRRGLPKGPYNIGWPQPPPEAVVYSAAPPRCSKASWSHTRLHKVECRCCWSWERKSFPSTERTGEYQRFDNKYKYPVLFSSLLSASLKEGWGKFAQIATYYFFLNIWLFLRTSCRKHFIWCNKRTLNWISCIF